MRTEPLIDLTAAQKHMPIGFPIIDPDEPLGRSQLAGLEMHGFASAHLAASHRALWRRIAELEAQLPGQTLVPPPSVVTQGSLDPAKLEPQKPAMDLQIEWTNDCQGKKDFDGDLVAISTRYWPGHAFVLNATHPEDGIQQVPAGLPSAKSKVRLFDGHPHHNGWSETLLEKDFEGDTFAEVAAQVETWAQEQAERIVKAMRTEFQAAT